MNDFNERFSGIARLYSAAGLERLRRAHVCVIGVGGVGSWAVEALARSGIGKLTLVDLDEVCVSNVNRQLHALTGTIGKPKIDVLAQRVHAINSKCEVVCLAEFFTSSNPEKILSGGYDYVIDAIDSLSNKCLLIAQCSAKNIPIITCGSAGGRRDPTRVQIMDLAHANYDRLLKAVRKKLRADYDFSRRPGKAFKIDCVFSPEPIMFPQKDGTVCAARVPADKDESLRLDCEWGLGAAMFVTGAFGFAAAAHVVARIAAKSAS